MTGRWGDGVAGPKLSAELRWSGSHWNLGRSAVFLKQPQILRPHRYAQGPQDDKSMGVLYEFQMRLP